MHGYGGQKHAYAEGGGGDHGRGKQVYMAENMGSCEGSRMIIWVISFTE